MNKNEKTELQLQRDFFDIQQQQYEQMDIIAAEVKKNVEEDREKADELYDFMQDQIDVEGDKNPETRKAMADSLGHKMKGTDQMIELLKVKAKLINPNKGTSVNINLGKYDEAKGGDTNDMISIVENLEDEMNNEY